MDGERLIGSVEGNNDRLERIKWMLTGKSGMEAGQAGGTEPRTPPYGDLTSLNTSRLILDSVGPYLLADIVEGFVGLLGTSGAVYEKNGDYALRRVSSGWCQFMDHASRRRCSTPDNRVAMESGQWHCHESCWQEAALRSIETKASADVACRGGIRVFAVPICTGTETLGSICVAYGDPPRDPEKLRELATDYGVSANDLSLQSEAYDTRPPFIIEWAKQRVLYAGRIIGEMVERKQAEQTLRKSEERFRSLVEFTSDWVWEVDKTGTYTYASPKIRGLLGYEPEETLGKTPFDFMPPGERDRVARIFHEARQSKTPLNSIVNTNIHKNGHEVDLETSAVPLLDADGNLLGYRGIDRDVTKRKQIEEALRESENRFRSLVMNSSDTITVLAADGTAKYQSPSLKRFFGYAPEELVGKDVFPYVHPDDLASAQAAFSEILKNPGTKVSLEYRFRHENGSWIHVESVGCNLLDEPGIWGIVLNTRDISERKRAEEALEKRIVALTQPLQDVESISFEDLFNLNELQQLQDLFANAWGVAALITRPDGTPITLPSNFTNFCGEFIRKNEKGLRSCQKSDATLGRHNPSGPIIQRCLSAGLWGAGASITVGGRHIASWLIGQVRNEAQSEEQIIEYARAIGADETAFRETFLQVPVMEQKTFEQVAHSLFALANQLSTSAYQNIQQARFISERKRVEKALRESERKLSEAQKIAQLGHWVWDVRTGHVEWSEEVFKIFHLDPNSFTPQIDSILALSPWPEDHERDKELIRRALASRERGTYEQRFLRPDNSIGYYFSSFEGKYDDNGNLVLIVGTVQDITERKKAEEKIKENERRLKEAQYIARLGNWELDLVNNTLQWSDSVYDLFEIDPMEFGASYEAFLEVVHPDDREMVGRAYTESLKNRTAYRVSHRLLMKDGRTRWVNEIGHTEYDKQGNPLKSFGTVQDITEQKQTEEALRNNEEKFRSIYEESPIGIELYDREGMLLHANRACLDIFGISDATAVKGFKLFEDPNLSEELKAQLRRGESVRYEIPFDFEKVTKLGLYETKKSGITHLDLSCTPLRDVTQESVIGYLLHLQDITERKHAEEALRESEARYSAVVQHAKDGVIIIQDNDLQFVNQSLGDILGYAPEELEKTPFMNYVAAENRAMIADRIKERLDGKDTPSIYETRLIRKDGTIIDVELSASVIQYGGKPTGVGIIRDIADRKRMEEERHKFEAQMREVQKLESLGILAGGIAHDFNNLLMAILGNADLANLSLSPVSPARNHLEEIIRASHRAADLCRQMLAYSGKGRFVVGRHDISEIVKEMGQMLDVSISKKAIMRYFLADGLPAVEADATQVRQVIMNLITNASEALGDMRGVITVSTGVMECDETYLSESYLDDHLPGGRYVYLEVSDTGCGMDTEAQRRIFDPFYTTKFTGRGLGLAAVLGIVRGHKGAIKVYSEVDKGTSFKILLPAVEWKPGERARTAEESVPLQGEGTILLIDDDAFVRTVASSMLAQLGFQVVTATNGREGLEIFHTHGDKITCVILDLMMPEMGGEETFLELRKVRSDVRVILSSGYNEQDVTQRFVGKGLSGFIQKPYTVANLRTALNRVLG